MPKTKKTKDTSAKYVTRQSSLRKTRTRRRRTLSETKSLGQHIVADPRICHGKPTFRGTRIMVWQVLEMLAEGLLWDEIIHECYDRITPEAIAEAIRLSSQAFLKHADEFVTAPLAA